MAGNIDLFNGVVTISPDGLLVIEGEVRAEKYSVATQDISSASAGKVIIKAGELSTYITTEALTDKSLIFATPNKPVILGTSKSDKENEFKITISAGVCVWNSKIKDAKTMIKLADDALYAAKKAGRNCVKTAEV